MIIPYDQLSQETLDALLEEFITREGTDYGAVEIPLDVKLNQLIRQIKKGEVLIVFDSASESTTLMTLQDFKSSGFENL